MNRSYKIITIIAVATLICISLFSLYYINSEGKKGDDQEDQTPPIIENITGDTTGTTGKITTISAKFSDNENVTSAIIYYKAEDENEWKNASILDGSYDIEIPSDPLKDWFYYITVDDKAGNGPIGNPSIDGSKYYTISVEKDIENLTRNVFIEEGTATWCSNCPEVADKLHSLYKSNDYNFYYVSMIQDKNSKAKDRLEQDFNIYAYPTVYIDGGYDIVIGNKGLDVFKEKITKAQRRDVPKLYIDVTPEINEEKTKIKTSVLVKNYEEEEYNGQLKIYLTERNSLQYYGGEGIYHNGFLDFLLDEKIEVSSKDEKITETTLDIGDMDPDNLMIIAVVFNSNSVDKYSNPPDEKIFETYYVDACDGSVVVEDANLKPEIGLTNPKNGRLHIFGKDITATLNLNTIIIGRTPIRVQASDDSKVEKVEIYIEDDLVAELNDEPYEYIWKSTPFFKFRYEIKVIAYDDMGKTSEEKIDVYAFILL
jgi:hypothetical protein